MEEVLKTQNKGKRKIPIEPITNKTKKQVTFSKRRGGLNKKGSELCCLCDANLAIITFSGAGKLFGFGHPSVEDVVQRYINNTGNKNNSFSDNRDNSNTVNQIGTLSTKYKEILSQIEVEKKFSSSSNNSNNNNNYINNNIGEFLWEVDIDQLGLVELQHYKIALERLRNDVATRVDEINRSSMNIVPQNFSFCTRDENMVAHYNQGLFDGSNNTSSIGYGMGRDNLYPPMVPMDSFCNMLMKKEA
ncbi:hypothetical protein RND81_12G153400 [Saponaria officinalis]|uniref:MADS-box domain-containing protein n=1 Tax=Saponaria officinalis TaxID=3572 RepID=A0AAW1HAZ4_SAPOF